MLQKPNQLLLLLNEDLVFVDQKLNVDQSLFSLTKQSSNPLMQLEEDGVLRKKALLPGVGRTKRLQRRFLGRSEGGLGHQKNGSIGRFGLVERVESAIVKTVEYLKDSVVLNTKEMLAEDLNFLPAGQISVWKGIDRVTSLARKEILHHGGGGQSQLLVLFEECLRLHQALGKVAFRGFDLSRCKGSPQKDPVASQTVQFFQKPFAAVLGEMLQGVQREDHVEEGIWKWLIPCRGRPAVGVVAVPLIGHPNAGSLRALFTGMH